MDYIYNNRFRRRSGNGVAYPDQSSETRVTRTHSGTLSRNLQQANRLVEELRREKQRAEGTITNLKNRQQHHEEDLRRKNFKIENLELRSRQLQDHKRRVEEECDQWREEARIIEVRHQYIMDKLLRPYVELHKLVFKGQPDEVLKKLLAMILFDLSQVSLLRRELQCSRNQVQELQQDMLARVDKVEVISDDQFAKEFRSLASSVKTLSRSVPVANSININSIFNSFVLLKGVAPHHWDGRARKKLFVESWIWSLLVSVVFDNPYAFFGEQCKVLNKAWVQVFGTEHFHNWPKPSEPAEEWRFKTVVHLMSQTSKNTITHGKSEHMLEGLTGRVIESRIMVMSIIAGHTEIVSPGCDHTLQIQLIVNKAFALAMQMSLQRSRIQVTYPVIGAAFDKEQMLPADEDEDEDMGQGAVAFIINPGLVKWGDTHGKNFDHRYDIVPSLVQLEQKDSFICAANGQVGTAVKVEADQARA